jgi:hypothetical protein
VYRRFVWRRFVEETFCRGDVLYVRQRHTHLHAMVTLRVFSCGPTYFLPLLLKQKSNITFNNFAAALVSTASKFSYRAILLAPTVEHETVHAKDSYITPYCIIMSLHFGTVFILF